MSRKLAKLLTRAAKNPRLRPMARAKLAEAHEQAKPKCAYCNDRRPEGCWYCR